MLALQLHRFQQRGAVVKNHGKVLLDDVIRVPIFRGRGSCAVQYQPYVLVAFIEHHGDTHFWTLYSHPGAGKLLEM